MMDKAGTGILLFAILFQLCSAGMEGVSLTIGVVGLGFVIAGAFGKKQGI